MKPPTSPATSPSSDYTKVDVAADTPEPLRLTLTWSDVHCSVPVKDAATNATSDKPLLRGVSGEALPGELLVIMGPSGAGKTTLLDCLAFRNRAATGSILVNGHAWTTPLARHAACYVLQDDLFYASLTVKEHLLFQAQLRMEPTATASDRASRVQQIMRDLGLATAADTPIGGASVKGLSGGQRKRLSLATEMLTSPSILFVDEPTSGLDSSTAEAAVRQIQSLARQGHTVIATIHQPNSALFALFDKLHLLADGRTVYRGPAADSVQFFAAQGFPCPAFMNPTDYFMAQLVAMDGDDGGSGRVQRLTDAWATHEARVPTATSPPLPPQLLKDDSGQRRRSPVTTVAVLCRRNLTRAVRDAVGFRARVASTIIMSCLCGLVFLQLSLSQTGVQDFTGVLFFLAVNQFIFSASPEFISVPLEIPLVLREHNGGLYHVLGWYVAKNVSELPFQLVFPLLFITPAYFLIGFPLELDVFLTFYLFIALTASAATGVGYMVSCLAKRVDMAPTIGAMFMLPFLLFGGLFLNSESTPVYFAWLEQISPIKYCFHGLMRAYWGSIDSVPCDADAICRVTSGGDVLRTNNITMDSKWLDCLVLLTVNAGFRVLGAAFLWLRAAKRNL